VEDLTVGARTVNELAYERLSGLIFSGALGLGERLDERFLAERMGISRTPLREAIAQLASNGIVERRPYQGNFVRTFTLKQIHDLYEVRKELEALAVRLAAPRLQDEGLRELAETVARCRLALDENDTEAFEQTDRDFHATILRYSDNEALIAALARLSLHIQLLRHLANREPSLPEHTMHEREAILDAFTRGETETAIAIMREHIDGAHSAAISQMAGDPAVSA